MGVQDPETGEYFDEYDSLDEAHLGYLRFSLEIGNCNGVRQKLERWRARLEASDTPAVRSEIAEIVREAGKAFVIEAEHGRGSLLKLDHPSVRRMIEASNRRPKPLIPHSHIRAAERYRELHRPEAPSHSL